ncbi:MAG: autotransporter-associated beta strand repeat-containing protein [Chthoniobacterales bacterium]|nr:autotransporter-associated beta strand repeat-containing protein [Chthoniobacterales bacterium]
MKSITLFFASLIGAVILLASSPVSQAGSATWDFNPTNGDWNTAANWTPATVPNGPADVATFGASNALNIFISADVEVAKIVFAAESNAFTLTANPLTTLTVSGAGLTNSAGVKEGLVSAVDSLSNAGEIVFTGSAAAGTLTTFTNAGNTTAKFDFGGTTRFLGTSTASHAALVNLGASASGGYGGLTYFGDHASADYASLTNEPGLAEGASGGTTSLDLSAQAGQASLTSNGATISGANGGNTTFAGNSHAASATLIANAGDNGGGGGQIVFIQNSSGDSCRVQLFGNGFLDISTHFGPPGAAKLPSTGPPLTIGSLEGDGVAILGGTPLKVGSSNLATIFSGVIEDGQYYAGGALLKIGTGTLTLSGSNSYTGGTTVSAGTLVINNAAGSGAGAGPVSVNAATLGGKGIVAGAVTIGTGSGAGAFLAPAHGTKQEASLTSLSGLTFEADSTYTCTFKAKGNKARTDKVIAKGVTINSGASFNFSGQVQGQLRQGLVLTVISNTSATPIAGTFSNLPDGAILTISGNNFQASYEGGDGNDLTLTVL